MPFKDLREFIARLEEEGEAIKIEEEIDWNLDEFVDKHIRIGLVFIGDVRLPEFDEGMDIFPQHLPGNSSLRQVELIR